VELMLFLDRIGLERRLLLSAQHVTFDFKITVQRRSASGLPRGVRALESPCAALADEAEPDQQFDDPGEGPYIVTLFGKRVPVSQLKTRRRRFGRRR
jgi:hypothetical protein